MLSSSGDGTISIWDAHKTDLLCELHRGNSNESFWSAFSMFADRIVSVYDYQELLLWQYEEI